MPPVAHQVSAPHVVIVLVLAAAAALVPRARAGTERKALADDEARRLLGLPRPGPAAHRGRGATDEVRVARGRLPAVDGG
ncbi:hypothetical protein ACFZAG_30330 [Streptomyces sp. NPDC012403]|uniref:hypothetical protein n=1 Tax=Streptomyces sp. NPDC012403 TaxID=3364831 RepID=UPI0036E8063B